MKYVKGLDTIRAMAVMLVFIWHFTTKHALDTVAGILEQLFLPSGVFAVTLFFVLSGYLITNILLHATEEEGPRIRIIKNFVVRRSLRIFPIYYATLFVLVITNGILTTELPYAATYTYNLYSFFTGKWGTGYGHTWSLSIEEQFYLVWPWLIVFVNRRYIKYVFVFIIAMGIISSFLTVQVYNAYFNVPRNVGTTNWLGTFGIGGLYAYLMRTEGWKAAFKKYLPYTCLLLLIPSYYWKLAPAFDVFPHGIYFKITVDSLLSLYIIHFVIHNKSVWLKKNVLENKQLNFIGRISYGLYLYHIPLEPVFKFLQDSLYKVIPSKLVYNGYFSLLPKFAITFAVAYLSYTFFEQKILRLKRRFE